MGRDGRGLERIGTEQLGAAGTGGAGTGSDRKGEARAVDSADKRFIESFVGWKHKISMKGMYRKCEAVTGKARYGDATKGVDRIGMDRNG